MVGEFLAVLFQSTPHKVLFFMFLITVVASIVFAVFERRLAVREQSEEDRLFYLARDIGCSEFDIFLRTGGTWNIPQSAIREDFKRYLYYEEIPFYVRSYLNAPDPDALLCGEEREKPRYAG